MTEGDAVYPHVVDSDTESDIDAYENYAPPKPFLMQFQQQRLPTFFLAPTVTFTLGALAISWLLCGLMAAVFLSENQKFTDVTVRYDHINEYVYPIGSAQSDPGLLRSFEVGGSVSSQGKRAVVSFTLEETIPGPVTMFYTIDPFFQNFRSYAESGDETQLLGEVRDKDSLYSCSPLRSPGQYYPSGEDLLNNPITADGISRTLGDFIYSPCGVKAWSLFNDSLVLEEIRSDAPTRMRCNSSDFNALGDRLTLSETQNPCRKKGIAWDVDYKRFRPAATGPTIWSREYTFTTDNEFLQNGWYFNEAGHSLPNPQDEDLISWLAISSTASIRKVWRILEGDLESHDTNGQQITYQMTVDEYFPTSAMGAEKKIMFMGGSSVWLQGPNPRIISPLLVTAGFSFLCFVIILTGCLINRLRKTSKAGASPSPSPNHARLSENIPDAKLESLATMLAKYKTVPSKTLEESLQPDSYESGQYVELCAQRQIDWERQKRDAKAYSQFKKAQEMERAECEKENVAPRHTA